MKTGSRTQLVDVQRLMSVDTGTVNGKYWIFALGMKVMLGAFFFEKGGI